MQSDDIKAALAAAGCTRGDATKIAARLTKAHELKVWRAYFQALADGRKPFEVRSIADRDFRVGDTLVLREWCPVEQEYTGRVCEREVTYVLAYCPEFGVMDGFAVLGLRAAQVEMEGRDA